MTSVEKIVIKNQVQVGFSRFDLLKSARHDYLINIITIINLMRFKIIFNRKLKEIYYLGVKKFLFIST